MCATLTSVVPEFTRPICSSISLGFVPAAAMRDAEGMRVGIGTGSVWFEKG